jgi:methylmalonyl-CoA mutase
MENLTNEMANKAWAIIEDIDKQGGMSKSIETGIPKLNIEKAAALKQARIDQGIDVIVGVNKYKLTNEDAVEFLEIDNEKVRTKQVDRLNKIRSTRDNDAVLNAMDELSHYAKTGEGNGLELAIKAIRARASVGEITYALEKVWGRYNATTQTVSGVFSKSYEQNEEWKMIQDRINNFINTTGRRPRMLVAKMGQDGHDRGAKVIATSFADLGFDIDLAPLFSTPQEVAKQAIENDVHVIGVSSQAAGHKTLIPELIQELKKLNASDIIVVCGGVIPKQDYDFLRKTGVKGIFGPGTPVTQSALEVIKAIEENIKD